MEKPVIKTQESDVKYLSLGYQNIDFNVGIFLFFEQDYSRCHIQFNTVRCIVQFEQKLLIYFLRTLQCSLLKSGRAKFSIRWNITP